MSQPDRAVQRRGRQPDPRGAGRVLRPLPPARRRGLEERRLRRRGRAGRDPAAQGRPGRGPPGRGRPRRHHRRVALPSCARSPRTGTITAGSASQISDGACAVIVMSKAKAEELGLDLARRDRRLRPGRRPRLHAPDAAGQRDQEGRRQGGHRRLPTSTSFEFNEAFAAVGIESARELGVDEEQGQRQRRRDRARPPGRHVRRPHRAAPRPRAQAPRRRHRRGRPVRRRWPGRRPDHPGAREGVTGPRRDPAGVGGARRPHLVAQARAGDARAVPG